MWEPQPDDAKGWTFLVLGAGMENLFMFWMSSPRRAGAIDNDICTLVRVTLAGPRPNQVCSQRLE